jgi:hypothetical protein
VVLAGAGTLAKATGRGMGRPCFRVIQNHFAAGNNVGDVAAKEEVWEVAAQLLGLGAAVAALTALEAAGAPDAVVPLWAGVHAAHVALRYASLRRLAFPYFNMKRGAAAAAAHVRGGRVPGVAACNWGEAVLAAPEAARPRCAFGCSLAQALGQAGAAPEVAPAGAAGTTALEALLELYAGERYLLTWRDSTAHVVLWEDAGPVDVLRALWQSAWLEAMDARGGEAAAGAAALGASVAAMRAAAGFAAFSAQAEAAGWQLQRTVVPMGAARLQRAPPPP